jgi:PPM family protein phosphatase
MDTVEIDEDEETRDVDVGSATHVGFVRDHNEDSILVEEDSRVFVVADGLGGHVAGEVASEIAVDRIREALDTQSLSNGAVPTDLLSESLHAANEAIGDDMAEHPDRAGMGTTAVIAHVSKDGDHAWVAHVGDSRAYLVRQGSLHRITEDHSSGGPFGRGAITQALGTGPIDPDVLSLELEKGDRMLLCTDGLTDMLRDDTIEEIVASGDQTAQDACDTLVDAALERGGIDNITVIVVDVD